MILTNFGTITNPLGPNRDFNSPSGVIGLGTSFVRLIIIVAGIFALFNFVLAGLSYITSQGDPKGVEAAQQKITMSLIGLLIIALSFILTAIAGLVILGDATAFLAPTIYGPGD